MGRKEALECLSWHFLHITDDRLQESLKIWKNFVHHLPSLVPANFVDCVEITMGEYVSHSGYVLQNTEKQLRKFLLDLI